MEGCLVGDCAHRAEEFLIELVFETNLSQQARLGSLRFLLKEILKK